MFRYILVENTDFTMYYNVFHFCKEIRHFLIAYGVCLGIFWQKTLILQCITMYFIFVKKSGTSKYYHQILKCAFIDQLYKSIGNLSDRNR